MMRSVIPARTSPIPAPYAKTAARLNRAGAPVFRAIRPEALLRSEEFASVCSVHSVVLLSSLLCPREPRGGAGAEGLPVLQQFEQGIAAEFFQQRLRKHDRDH